MHCQGPSPGSISAGTRTYAHPGRDRVLNIVSEIKLEFYRLTLFRVTVSIVSITPEQITGTLRARGDHNCIAGLPIV